MVSRKKVLAYLRSEFDLVTRCRSYHMPFWQCPQFLFVLMGGITIAALIVFYFTFVGVLDPYSVALASLGLAAFLLIQAYVILHAFERSAEANRLQAEFIGIASHQLRSPVTAARWALDFLVSDASRGLSLEAQNCVHIARDAVASIGQLVTAILRTIRVEAGTNVLHPTAVSLNTLVKESVASAQSYAHAAHLEVVFNAPEHEMFVRVDAEQIRFVLEHLIDNALRYTKRSGTVKVDIRDDDSNMVRVEVRDQGEGIPLHEQPHVFEKFFRASNAYTLAPSGAGLSLYASRAIVEDSGGRIGFRSASGDGSVFWFTLPRATQPEK